MKKKKEIKYGCEGCIYLGCRLYRDTCEKDDVEMIIPDEVYNWILLAGCASRKESYEPT